MPKKSHKSKILSDLQISNLLACIPAYYRSFSWQRVFALDEDGCSLITFYQQCRDHDLTIMVIEDQHGWKFGGFCTEAWDRKFRFFGSGENILYSFGDQDEPVLYRWQGQGDQHMFASDQSLGLAGCNTQGRFALFLGNDLFIGSSHFVDTYENEPLSKEPDFKCYHMEVWALQ